MENGKVGKYTVAFGFSAAMAALLNALLVIAKENHAALKDWMKAAGGHHWLSHGVIVLAFFLVLGLALAAGLSQAPDRPGAQRLAAIVALATLAASALIAGFFLLQP